MRKAHTLELTMHLGAFSVSLAVKDLRASRAFYEHLGFVVVGGAAEQGWLIVRNREHSIGLFQGMFDKNLLTFNPGWAPDCSPLSSFTDVRELQKALKAKGVVVKNEVDEAGSGPGSFMIKDPDGNPILIDQHV